VGNIQTRSDRDGYIARWRDSDNRRRSKSFRTKGEAQRFLVQIEAAKVQGDYIDPHRSKMTVETWAVEFRRLRARRRPGTIEWEDAALRTHVLPAFGKRSMGSIRRTDIQEFVDRLAGTYAPSTVARHYGFLHVFFQEAMDLDVPVINRNPCRKIVLPDEEEREQRFFTPEEVRQLYDTFAPRYKPMVLVGCYAGLRIGEQGGLRASDILFGHGEISCGRGRSNRWRGRWRSVRSRRSTPGGGWTSHSFSSTSWPGTSRSTLRRRRGRLPGCCSQVPRGSRCDPGTGGGATGTQP
jgi:integrase